MKKYLNILVSVSIFFPAFVSFQAAAGEPQQIPRIVVKPGPDPSGGGVLTGIGVVTPVATLPPIEVRPRPENPDGDENAAAETNETIVTKYKPPCKKANESSEVFTAKVILECTNKSTETAFSQHPILRLTPNATRVEMEQLCTAHITDLTLSNKIQSC